MVSAGWDDTERTDVAHMFNMDKENYQDIGGKLAIIRAG